METQQETKETKRRNRVSIQTEKPKDSKHKREGDLYRVTTLKELGPNLPIPMKQADGTTVAKRSFSFLEWDMEMEEILSKAKTKAKTVGLFVNDMMGFILDDLCGISFQDMDPTHRVLKISQLEFSNIMYMYIYLRVEELGPTIRMDVGCPSCGQLNKDWRGSLNDLEVRVKDPDVPAVEGKGDKKGKDAIKGHPRTSDYEFRKPLLMEDKKILTGVTLDIGKWEAMEQADAEIAKNPAKMKRLLFESSMVGVLDKDGPVQGFYDMQTVIGKLKKIDIEMCMMEMVENNAGPIMAIQGECVHCGTEWFKELDWSYDYFLDSSSL